MPPTLQSLVSGVIRQVVVLILLKEVGSMHLIATLHQPLIETETQKIPVSPSATTLLRVALGKWLPSRNYKTPKFSGICVQVQDKDQKKDKTQPSCSVV